MDLRKLLVIPALSGLLALGACAGEEDEDIGVVEDEGVGVVEEGGVVGAAEIPGNGIDDDGDGLIDEEA